MKFSYILTAFSAIAMPTVAAVEVSTVAFDETDYSILADAKDGTKTYTKGKTTGQAALKPAFISLLNGASGNPFSFHDNKMKGAGEGAVIQTTFLTATSDRHVDHLPADESGVRRPVPKGERVAFLPLETNDDAYFDVEDICVPIEEGNLIQFDGGSPHHTVVKSGTVSLIGPFHTKTMENVGSICNGGGPDGVCDLSTENCFVCQVRIESSSTESLC